MEKNYTNEGFGVDEMADAMDINKRQLNRKLNTLLDSSITKLLQNFRLQKAAELLNDQALRVGEVGFMVGFSSRSYFNKCFRAKFNNTPKEFQQNLQKNT